MARTSKVKKEEKIELTNQQIGGLLIVLFSAFAMCVAFTGFYFKFYGEESYSAHDVLEISGKNSNVVVTDTKDIDTDNIFANTYYEALDKFATTIGHGTTWLEICPDSQEKIGDDIYFKVCDSRFNSRQSIVDYFKKLFTEEYVEELISEDYIIHNGELYITPVSVQTDTSYQGLSSYTVKTVTPNKIIYLVKSKYSTNDVDYTYQEHKFILNNVNGNWLVSNFEMPY